MSMMFILANQGAPPDTTPPTQVTGLWALDSPSVNINLNWNPATDNVEVIGYVVNYSTNGGSTWNLDGTTTEAGGYGGNPPYVFTGIALTQYWFRVQAYDAANNYGAWSATAGPIWTGDFI